MSFHHRPPRIARLILRLLSRLPGGEFVAGDIEEGFRQRTREGASPKEARRWYRRQVLLSGTALGAHRLAGRRVVRHFTTRIQRDEEGEEMRIESVLRDVRLAARSLRKEPGFSALVLLTLALGIGAGTAIFSVVNGVMLQALPYPEADRLVRVAETVGRDAQNAVPNAMAYFRDWQERTSSFETLAPYQPFATVAFTGDDQGAARLTSTYATSGYFQLLGGTPALGRLFNEGEDRAPPLEAPVVVLSHGFWERRFGGDPGVLGSSVRLDGRPYEIIGVMEKGFFDISGSAQVDVWLPVAMAYPEAEAADLRTTRIFQVMGRLREGRTLDRALEEVHGVAAAVAEEYPDVHGSTWATVIPMRRQILGGLRQPLFALLAGAGFLLLVACVNVASLLLVRGGRRSREVALRQTLGASRRRLLRQFVTEAVVLSVLGGLLGVALAFFSVDSIMGVSGINLPGYVDVGVDVTVLLTALAVAMVTGVAFGLWPAFRSSRTDLRGELTRSDARAGGGAGSPMLRSGLVVLEVAVAMVLLVGSGLMIRSFRALEGTELGFRTEGVLTLQTNLSQADYPTSEDVYVFNRQLRERLRALPGVSFAGIWGPNVPGQVGTFTTVVPEGRTVETQLDADLTRVHQVSPGAMEEMGISLLAGRGIEEGDGPDSRPVVVVSESLARTVWPGEDPLEKRFRHFAPPGSDPTDFPLYEVVGVVSDALHSGRGINTTSFPNTHDVYFPYRQRQNSIIRNLALLVGTEGDPAALAPRVRSTLEELAPNDPVFGVQSMEERLAGQLVVPRFTALLMSIFGALSLFLAAMGIYGLLANAVSARSREIGLRKALGAQPGATVRLFVGEGMKLASAGVLVGLAASLVLTRFMRSLLFEIDPTDAATLVGTTAVLLGVALLACLVPSRRAARLDPMVTLRAD